MGTSSKIHKLATYLLKLAYVSLLEENPIISFDSLEKADKPIYGGSADLAVYRYKDKEYVVKSYERRADPFGQAFWEWATGLLFKKAGFSVPNLMLVLKNGSAMIASEFIGGAKTFEEVYSRIAQKIKQDMQQGLLPLFAATAHWDWAGAELDNIIEKGGIHYYIDTSAGPFRALGERKPIFAPETSKEEHAEDVHATIKTLKQYDSSDILNDVDQLKAIKKLQPILKDLIGFVDQIIQYAKSKGVPEQVCEELRIYETRLKALQL